MPNEHRMLQRGRLFHLSLLLLCFAWPPIFFLYVAPQIQSDGVSHADLVRFMKVHRYTFQVPDDKDGWILSIQPVRNGKAQDVGGAGVCRGDRITVLLRRIRNAEKAEYYWYSDHQSGGGVVDDPVAGCGVFVERPSGAVEIGDYLAVGNDGELQLTPRTSDYDGELRLVLTDPHGDVITK
jgi:hypothetical protein